MHGAIFMLLGVLPTIGWSAPTEMRGCDINSFELSTFNDSLLLENHFMCHTKGDRIPTADFCEHLYKCPLDFTNKVRHCEAICKSDGTWDYKYPSCEDMIPLAEFLELEIIEEEQSKIFDRRRQHAAKYDKNADAILHALESQNHGKRIDEVVLRKDSEEKLQTRIKRWALVRPPQTATSTTTTSQATTGPLEKNVPSPEPTLPVAVQMKKISALCLGHMCPRLRGGKSCKIIEDMKSNDAQLQKKICEICVKVFCQASINLFGSGR